MSGPLTVLILMSNDPDFKSLKDRYDNVLYYARTSMINNNYSISTTYSYNKDGKEEKNDIHSYEIYSIIDSSSNQFDGVSKLSSLQSGSFSPLYDTYPSFNNGTRNFHYKLPVSTAEITPEIYYERFRFHQTALKVTDDGTDKSLDWDNWKKWTGTIPAGIISPGNIQAWLIYNSGIESLVSGEDMSAFPGGVSPPDSWMAVLSDSGEPFLYVGFFMYRFSTNYGSYGVDYLNVYYKLTTAEYEAGIV